MDLYINRWHTEMWSRDKLVTYRQFKTVFGFEPYLCIIKSPIMRREFSRYRMSSHSLEIERGRYPPRVARLQRVCRQCNLNLIDDEYHFMLICDRYAHLR